MTPAARQAAAITVLDRVIAGEPAEAALTRWARASRFAGSGDRLAVRDLVFAALRRRRSALAASGAGDETGRDLLIGLARLEGESPDWDGQGHAPPALSTAERARPPRPPTRAEALDCPDWLLPLFETSLGAQTDTVLEALRRRAPVFLRVNVARLSLSAAQAALAAEGIDTTPHPLAGTALQVTSNPRRVRVSAAFADGLVELQDAASQAVAARFAAGLASGTRVLDYCAGGGGKSLALAAAGLQVSAHDADAGRMRDLPARAARAGARIDLTGAPRPGWPAILADAPCSGSGSWRRNPEGKWTLTPERLAQLTAIQGKILDRCARLVAPGGRLGYATCSLLSAENDAQVAAFIGRNPGWTLDDARQFTPLDGGDGFYLAVLSRGR